MLNSNLKAKLWRIKDEEIALPRTSTFNSPTKKQEGFERMLVDHFKFNQMMTPIVTTVPICILSTRNQNSLWNLAHS